MSIQASLGIFLAIGFFGADASATTRDWKYSVLGSVTRCFETKSVQVHCEDFTREDTRRRREELQIDAVDYMGRRFNYSYQQGIEGSLCQEHLSRIRASLRGTRQVCIAGQDELVLDSGETLAKWDALETPRGEVKR